MPQVILTHCFIIKFSIQLANNEIGKGNEEKVFAKTNLKHPMFNITVTVGEDFYGETGNVFSTVFHKYNSNFRPYDSSLSEAIAVPITVNMTVVRLGEYDMQKMEMQSIIDLRIRWRDGRLYWYSDIINYITVNNSDVWTPDVEFLNADSPPVLVINPRYLIVQKTGEVFWYRRFKVTTSCHREKDNDDKIICPIRIGSFQFSTNEQIFSSINCTSTEIDLSADIPITYNVSKPPTNSSSAGNMTSIPVDFYENYIVINNMNITDFYSAVAENQVLEIPYGNSIVSEASCNVKFREVVKVEHKPLPIIQITNNGAYRVLDVMFFVTCLLVTLL
ncbi:hypothetical protein FSP39_025232 [Pinctada imbricata]|uniref:Neurotransmitter-gated ion-channel ligand-binding domain-containing protein n=1 Tax=Pinctada imbricata TaxID=66713 RepID=A0AA89BRX7_PINIB|nr:hypothetical protein FSP39_025232 [Pinctada imbricata]